MPASEIIDSKQCAALLRCTAVEVEDMASSGEIPALHIASAWLFVRSDLLIFLAHKARSDAQQRRLAPRVKPLAPAPVKPPAPPAVTATRDVEPALKLVPASEAARLLSMGKSTFWHEVKQKNLPQPVKIGGMTRWLVADLVRFVDAIGRKDTRSRSETQTTASDV